MEIKIKVFSMFEQCNILLDTAKKVFVCNGKNVNLDVNEFCKHFLDVVKSWNKDLSMPNVFDAEVYEVTLQKDDKIQTFKGNGKYPDNYKEFKDILKVVQQC